MATTPNPAQLGAYQSRLATLVSERAAQQVVRNHHKVRNLNRQILAQEKWIAAAQQAAQAK